MAIEEDVRTEFKGHRDLTKLDISTTKYHKTRNGEFEPKAIRARATLSKTICGMLNTGLECKIYLGINDDGTVEGLMLSLYQKDHFMVSLRDLLRRFEPPGNHRIYVIIQSYVIEGWIEYVSPSFVQLNF